MNKLYIKDGKISLRKNIKIYKPNSIIYNPTEKILFENGWQIYEPPVIEEQSVSQEEQYKQRIIELVREKYSIDDELAIQRQRDTKIDEFNAYNTFVEECKVTARREIYGDELI